MPKKKTATILLTILLCVTQLITFVQTKPVQAAKKFKYDSTYVKNNKDFKKMLEIYPHSDFCGTEKCIGFDWALDIIDKETGDKMHLKGSIVPAENAKGRKIKNTYWLFDDADSDFIGDVAFTVKILSSKKLKINASAYTNNGKLAIGYFNLSGKYKLTKRVNTGISN